MHRQYLPLVAIALCVFALYGGFLYNPIVFDDIYFFLPGAPERVLENLQFYPRQLVAATLALTWKWIGPGLFIFRAQNMCLHIFVSLALYFFVRQVQFVLIEDSSRRSVVLPLLAALVFALHPVAVYGAAYLIERTIVMATLFALLSWGFLLAHLRAGRQSWLWCSVVMYAASVMSKEHAVMVPFVGCALAVWWWRTQLPRPSGWQMLLRMRHAIGVCALIFLLIVMFARGVLGRPYELEAADMLREVMPAHAWPLSVVTQGFMFFKYLVLWVLPNPMWMSVDMREPFAQTFLSWPQAPGFALFVSWPFFAAGLLWNGGRKGLIGFAMIAPWLLFATELTTVRIQEILVLYRSYLWMVPSFAILLLLESKLSARYKILLLIAVPLLLFPLAFNRLTTFSHRLLLWDDAARLAEGKVGVTGLDRIYRNRGNALANAGKYDLAIEDYSRAIESKPDFYHAYNDRAAAFLKLQRYPEALMDFNAALALKVDHPSSNMGRAAALDAMGRIDEARESYRKACSVGWRSACDKK